MIKKLIPITDGPSIAPSQKSTEAQFIAFSDLPVRRLSNSVCHLRANLQTDELKRKIEKNLGISSLRINQAQKRTKYKKYQNKKYANFAHLPNEKILLEVSPSRGPLIITDPGVVLCKLELIVQNYIFELEKLKKKGPFDPAHLGAWYPKKASVRAEEFVEYRVEFLKISLLKSYLEQHLNVSDLKLEGLAFRITTNQGVSISPFFDLVSRIYSLRRFSLYVNSFQSIFYNPIQITEHAQIQNLEEDQEEEEDIDWEAVFDTPLPLDFYQ